MSQHRVSKPVTLHILDKEYVVACPLEERENLLASAAYLSDKMEEVRDNGKIVSGERLLVMTALNIVHELLQYRQGKDYYRNQEMMIRRLEDKIERALSSE